MMTDTIRLLLLREPEPPSPDGSAVRFGLQDKKGAMHEGVARADDLVQFEFDVRVEGGPAQGPPDFSGLFVSGSRGERFVYLSWQKLEGAGFMNRIKVRLADIDWALVQAAEAGGKTLEANLRGVATGGGRRPVAWREVD
jgi:hypothetical protein